MSPASARNWLVRLLMLSAAFGLLQGLSGALLGGYYQPHPELARDAVVLIEERHDWGWLFRAWHSWNSSFLVLLAMAQVGCVFIARDLLKGMKGLWLLAHLQAGALIASATVGYILIWDQRALAAAISLIGVLSNLPLLGGVLQGMVQGAEVHTPETVAKLSILHLAVLPWIWVASWQGTALLAWREEREPAGVSFRQAGMVGFCVLHVLLVACLFGAGEIGPAADPFAPAPAGVQPEWHILPFFALYVQVASAAGSFAGLGAIAFWIGAWLALPFAGRWLPGHVIDLLGALFFAVYVGLGALALIAGVS